jgi:hypothetical protein
MTVAHEIPWRRKQWLGKVTGRDGKYGVGLDFRRGEPVKSRGILKFQLEPGFYVEVKGAGREYFECDGLEVRYIPETLYELMGAAAEGPAPGSNGAWNSSHCCCGALVERYSSDLFPFCEPCFATTAAATQAPKRDLVPNIVGGR